MHKTLSLFVVMLLASPVKATTIQYQVTPLGGDDWRYDYIVSNDSLVTDINEFTIYFDIQLYEQLVPVNGVIGWDVEVVQPGSFLNLNDGYYDALNPVGLQAGESEGLFSVQFSWLGDGAPGSQRFEIVDPSSFAVLDDGFTQLVPVPAAVWLFASGLLLLINTARKQA